MNKGQERDIKARLHQNKKKTDANKKEHDIHAITMMAMASANTGIVVGMLGVLTSIPGSPFTLDHAKKLVTASYDSVINQLKEQYLPIPPVLEDQKNIILSQLNLLK